MNGFALALLLSTTCFYLSPILPISGLIYPTIAVSVYCLRKHLYIVAGLFSGVSLICIHGYFFQLERLPNELIGVDIGVIGRISGIPKNIGRTITFGFELESVTSGIELPSVPRSLRLSCYQCELQLLSGQKWLLTVRLKPGRGMLNPGGFDYEKWLRAKGVDAVGYVRTKSENRVLDSSTSFRGLRAKLRRELQSSALSDEAKSLTQALALGDGSMLGALFWDVLRKTGTSHLMVISGLHITLIAASVTWIFSLLWRPLTLASWFTASRSTFSFSAGVIAAIMYAALAGFTVPTVRALIMLLSYMFFLRTRHHLGSMKPLAISLVVVLLFQPYSPLLPGFWLSFYAVAFIHFYLSTRDVRRHWFLSYVYWHFALTIGMAPITVFFFGYFAPLSMLANGVAVPVVSMVVVPLVLVGAILFVAIEPLGIFVLEFASQIMSILFDWLSLLAELDVSQIWLPDVSFTRCLLFFLGVVIWLIPVGVRFRWLTVPLLSAVFLFDFEPVKKGEFEVKVVDVGQGLSVLLSTQSHHLLFDTGGRLGRVRTIADAVVLPMLKFKGIEVLDKLIISHPDSDHAAGVGSITKTISVSSVVTELSFANEIRADEYCKQGDSWQWDGVRFEFINNSVESIGSENNRSCVLVVSSGLSRVMLPGDIEKEAEQALVSQYRPEELSLIVAPHHGSRTSSSEEFLQHFKPKAVVYSVGFRNRHGFPHTDIAERYERIGAQAYRTDRDGMLTFRFNENGLKYEPQAYRNAHREFWRSDFDLRLQ